METYKEIKERHEREIKECGCVLRVLNKHGGVKIEVMTPNDDNPKENKYLRFDTPEADGRFDEFFDSLKEGDKIRITKEEKMMMISQGL